MRRVCEGALQMNYTVLAMTLAILVLAVFLPLSAIAFIMIKSTSSSDDFSLGAVSLQDELHNFLAEFESGSHTADNWR